jgi:hypothetical protein
MILEDIYHLSKVHLRLYSYYEKNWQRMIVSLLSWPEATYGNYQGLRLRSPVWVILALGAFVLGSPRWECVPQKPFGNKRIGAEIFVVWASTFSRMCLGRSQAFRGGMGSAWRKIDLSQYTWFWKSLSLEQELSETVFPLCRGLTTNDPFPSWSAWSNVLQRSRSRSQIPCTGDFGFQAELVCPRDPLGSNRRVAKMPILWGSGFSKK